MAVIESAKLYYKEGASDKVYNVTLEELGGSYVVNFEYGRRGSALKAGSKTNSATSLAEAKNIFNTLVKEKTGKGYKYIDGVKSESINVLGDLPDTPTELQCVLLNPISQQEAVSLLEDDRWAAQEKLDGVRFMLKKEVGTSPTAFNRKGKRANVPTVIWNVIKNDKDFFIDGELIGEDYHVFDILEYDKKCVRNHDLISRMKILENLVKHINSPNIIYTKIYRETEEKRKLYKDLLENNKEGIVFKKESSNYYTGRPASGGSYLKHKFYATCSCIVTAINKKRSAALGLYKGKKIVSAGNVTVLPNFTIPEVGSIVEVKYLYARKQSGSLYQPIFLGNRTDIDPKECTQNQLKFKNEED